jgi:uncharacterized LabA/DUF88 family protein
MNIAVFLDLSDLYHRVNRKFGRKINFAASMELFSSRGSVLVAHAYGIQRGNEASGFITCLQRLGFEPHFKYPEIIRCGDRELKRSNWGVGMTVDALSLFIEEHRNPEHWEVILGSGSNNMAPLVSYLTENGIRCVVFACSVGKELRHLATEVLEIDEGLLE